MASADWSNPKGPPFPVRQDDRARPGRRVPGLPGRVLHLGHDAATKASGSPTWSPPQGRRASSQDYSQVALLLHSVRDEHSEPYLDALEEKGIPAFCPRARAYFENDEVRLMVALLRAPPRLLRGRPRRAHGPSARPSWPAYVDECLVVARRRTRRRTRSARPGARARRARSQHSSEGESLDLRPADYFYRLLALEPFRRLRQEREPGPQPRDPLAAPERVPELLPLHRRHGAQPRVPALPPLQQLPAAAARRRHQRVRGPGPALPEGLRSGDDDPPGEGTGVPGRRRRQPRQSAARPASRSTATSGRSTTGPRSSRRAGSRCSTACGSTTSPSRGRRRCSC